MRHLGTTKSNIARTPTHKPKWRGNPIELAIGHITVYTHNQSENDESGEDEEGESGPSEDDDAEEGVQTDYWQSAQVVPAFVTPVCPISPN